MALAARLMLADAAPAPGDGATAARRPSSRTIGVAVLLGLAAIGLTQLQLVVGGRLSVDADLLTYAAVPVALVAAVVVAARLGRRPLRDFGWVVPPSVSLTLLFSAVLGFLFLIVEIYPGFLFGFGRVPSPTTVLFAFFLLSAPLVAWGQEALFRGYILRSLSRLVPLSAALAVSAGLFAVATTNLVSLPGLGLVAGGEYVFGTTVANLVLGLVLGFLFYKGRWSLLGPVATRTTLLWITTLVPIAAKFPNWETGFAALLLAYGILLAVVAVALREPRLQAHRYLREPFGPRRLRFRERARNRRDLRSSAVGVAALAVVFVAATQVAPVALGTPSPLLAIATGSMVPTLHRGTLVVVEHASPSQIHVGTIIAFHVSCLPAPTVHRVIEIVQGGASPVYQTKGDANPSPDPCRVPYADVLGRVVVIVPYLGLLVLSPLLDGALVALIIIVSLLVPRREP